MTSSTDEKITDAVTEKKVGENEEVSGFRIVGSLPLKVGYNIFDQIYNYA